MQWINTARMASSGLVAVGLVLLVYWLVLRGLDAMQRRSPHSTVIVNVLRQTTGWLALTMALLVVLESFGMWQNAWSFFTALFGLVAVGFFAFWSVLSNLLCSAMLLLSRPFRIGDTLELPTEQARGEVVNFDLLFTTLRNAEGESVFIPNNFFFQKAFRLRSAVTSVSIDARMAGKA